MICQNMRSILDRTQTESTYGRDNSRNQNLYLPGVGCFDTSSRVEEAVKTNFGMTVSRQQVETTALNLSPALMNAESLTQSRTFYSAPSQTQLSGMSYAQQGWLTKGQHFL
ncbi:hypothetical protein PLA106_25233 [Pseudomonas amygdali pv. lachrymans str. M302278]|nr:hypothetical protein PLA106_25233 [Pseudomonas amygdali pv. lachrymans str. M302278]